MKFNIDARGFLGNIFPFLIPISGQWREKPYIAAGDKARRRYGQSRYMPHQNVREKTRRVRQLEAIAAKHSPKAKLLVLQNKKTGDMMSFTLQA